MASRLAAVAAHGGDGAGRYVLKFLGQFRDAREQPIGSRKSS